MTALLAVVICDPGCMPFCGALIELAGTRYSEVQIFLPRRGNTVRDRQGAAMLPSA